MTSNWKNHHWDWAIRQRQHRARHQAPRNLLGVLKRTGHGTYDLLGARPADELNLYNSSKQHCHSVQAPFNHDTLLQSPLCSAAQSVQFRVNQDFFWPISS